MVAALIFGVLAVGLIVGVVFGFGIGTARTAEALKLARYLEAIALADDLVKTPDAVELRPRAQKLLAAHRAATTTKES